MKKIFLCLFSTMLIVANSNAQQNNTTTTSAKVPGVVSYGPHGKIFIQLSKVEDMDVEIQKLGLTSDSIKFVLIVPVKASGSKWLGYEQVYGSALRQKIEPCERWVADTISQLNMLIKERVYVLTDLANIEDEKNGKPKKEFFIPVIEESYPRGLSIGETLMGTLEEFEQVAEISSNGEMEMFTDNIKYKWEEFPSANSKLLVMISKERMMR